MDTTGHWKTYGRLKMLPDEMEAEKNRKIILAQADEIEMLKTNVRDLQQQLTAARIRNAELIKQGFNIIKEDINANTTG